MSNSAVVILSHANSDLKLNILKECIDEVKKKGYKIILSSSYPIPSDVQLSVDYCVLDNENPLIMGDDLNQIGGVIFFNLKYPKFENYYCVDVNHAYAVLKLMKNASLLAKINQIENLHYVNYDYIILDDNLLINNDNSLLENDLYYYYSDNDFMNTAIFSVKTDVMVSLFNDINNKREFCQKECPILEKLMLKTFREKNIKMERELFDNIKNKNNFDLINTGDFYISKNENGIDNKLFLYLSIDQNDNNKHYLVIKSDIKSILNIKSEKFNTDIEIGPLPRVFKIDYEDLVSGLDLYVPEFDHRDRFDLNKKLCICKIISNDVVEYLDKKI